MDEVQLGGLTGPRECGLSCPLPSRQDSPQQGLEMLRLPPASSAARQASLSLFIQLWLSEMGLGLPFQLLPCPQQRPFQRRACVTQNGDGTFIPPGLG